MPGTYFRLLLIGYFERTDAERGIAWRSGDSLALRGFLRLDLSEAPPEHTTGSRTRRLIDLETHRAVFSRAQPRGRCIAKCHNQRCVVASDAFSGPPTTHDS